MSRRTLIAATVLLLLALAGGGVGVYFAVRTPPRHHAKLLNQPTEQRRIRTLKPGAQPGFPITKPKVEKHEEGH